MDEPQGGGDTASSNGTTEIRDGSEMQAARAWRSHVKRNKSIIVDLFQGQLRSAVHCNCKGCGHASSTYDPFMYLSLPLGDDGTGGAWHAGGDPLQQCIALSAARKYSPATAVGCATRVNSTRA